MLTKDEVASEIAKKHFQIEAGLKRIFRLRSGADLELNPVEPIKLLEVNEATIPSGILPLQFGPVPGSGVPYPSIIVEITPDEFEKVKANELTLPQGWIIGAELPRPSQDNGES